MDGRPSELLLSDDFPCDALDDGGAGEEHIGRVLNHYVEVREGRRIDRPAGARAEYSRNLGNHAGGQDVPFKYLPEAGQ